MATVHLYFRSQVTVGAKAAGEIVEAAVALHLALVKAGDPGGGVTVASDDGTDVRVVAPVVEANVPETAPEPAPAPVVPKTEPAKAPAPSAHSRKKEF